MIPRANASPPATGGMNWPSPVAMLSPRNSTGLPGVKKLKLKDASTTTPTAISTTTTIDVVFNFEAMLFLSKDWPADGSQRLPMIGDLFDTTSTLAKEPVQRHGV